MEPGAFSHKLTDFGTNVVLTHSAAEFICTVKRKQQLVKNLLG